MEGNCPVVGNSAVEEFWAARRRAIADSSTLLRLRRNDRRYCWIDIVNPCPAVSVLKVLIQNAKSPVAALPVLWSCTRTMKL